MADQSFKSLMAKSTGLMITLSLLVILVFGFLVLKPLLISNAQLQNQLVAKRQEADYLKQKLEDLKILEKNYNQIRDEALIIGSALPTFENESELLVQISNLASKNGLFVTSLNPAGGSQTQPTSPSPGQTEEQGQTGGQSQTELPYKTYAFSLEAIAPSYTNLQNYLSSLQKNLRPINLTGMTVAKNASEGTALKVTLQLETYYQ